MQKVKYTKHILYRLKLRKIPKKAIESILENPSAVYFDSLNNTKIAVKKIVKQTYMVAFTEEKGALKVITIHPIKLKQIRNREASGRWQKVKL